MEMSTRYWPSPLASNGTVKSQFMYTRLIPKEFIRVDHPRQRCNPDKNDAWSRADCEIDCFERAVTSVTNCRFFFFSFLLFNSSAQYAVGVCNDINKYRSRLPYMASDRVPYCNTSASVRQTEELIAQLITETRSQLNCNCIESCTKACTPNGENSIPGKLDFILVLCVFVCLRVQVVYMYESESHTLEIDYGRIKVLYNNVYPVIIVKSCWGFWKKKGILRHGFVGDGPRTLRLFLGQTFVWRWKHSLFAAGRLAAEFLRSGRLRRFHGYPMLLLSSQWATSILDTFSYWPHKVIAVHPLDRREKGGRIHLGLSDISKSHWRESIDFVSVSTGIGDGNHQRLSASSPGKVSSRPRIAGSAVAHIIDFLFIRRQTFARFSTYVRPPPPSSIMVISPPIVYSQLACNAIYNFIPPPTPSIRSNLLKYSTADRMCSARPFSYTLRDIPREDKVHLILLVAPAISNNVRISFLIRNLRYWNRRYLPLLPSNDYKVWRYIGQHGTRPSYTQAGYVACIIGIHIVDYNNRTCRV